MQLSEPLWKQLINSRSTERMFRPVHPRTTTISENRYLFITTRGNKSITAFQLARDLYTATASRDSCIIVCRSLHNRGLFALRPASYVPLTSAHKKYAFSLVQKSSTLHQRSMENNSVQSMFSLNKDSTTYRQTSDKKIIIAAEVDGKGRNNVRWAHILPIFVKISMIDDTFVMISLYSMFVYSEMQFVLILF